jgi:membrane protein required for colicin V production
VIFDIIFLVFIGVAFWWGYTKGVIYSLFSLGGYFLGIFVALKFSYIAVKYLHQILDLSPKILAIVAFSLVFILIMLLVRLLAWILEQILKSFSLNITNQIVGGVIHALIGLYILCVLVWFGNKWEMLSEMEKKQSHVYPYIENLGPDVMEITGKAIPVMKTTFSEFESLLTEEDKSVDENTAD